MNALAMALRNLQISRRSEAGTGPRLIPFVVNIREDALPRCYRWAEIHAALCDAVV